MKSSLSDRVKQIPIGDVLRRYGFPPGRGGFISCPFHEDRTPSFKVYGDTNTWYCFSCRRHGTAVDFVMDLFGLPFKEAVDKLAGDFGIRAPEREPAEIREEIRKREEKRAEERVTDEKWNFFHDALWDRYDTLYGVITQRGRLLTGAEYAEMEWLGYFLDTYPLGAKVPAEHKKKILDREWSVHLPLLEEYAEKLTKRSEALARAGAESGRSREADRAESSEQTGHRQRPEDAPEREDRTIPEVIRSWLREDPGTGQTAGLYVPQREI